MLELKKITKTYQTESFKQKALDNVSITFRENEFASILGPSGSGKTTLLNIIGGLDHYDSGDLIINGISTKKYKDRAWDTYRNHRVGFVFQSYNLITHQSVLANVELALTLSGVSKKDRKERAKEALKEVGLEKHMNKRPSQLSGGQMQRVAIARALVNNPDILLADEPTGALDTETSKQVMDILKKVAKNKLVIMVTHNPELAKDYSTRIINIKDGKILSDSNPYKATKETEENLKDTNKKTKMSFLTALSLSFNNLMTKKARTILVAIAGSIGIIGIALIMAVSTGFQNYVDSIQEDTLTSYPLTIMQESTDITGALLAMTEGSGENDKTNKVVEKQFITSMLSSVSTNDLKSFKEYINNNYKEVENDLSNILYSYSVDPNIYTVDASKKLAKLNPSNLFSSMMGGNSLMSSYSSMASIFTQMVDNREEIEGEYDVLAGRWPKEYNEMIIVLSEPNGISDLLVYSLGLRDTKELNDMVTKIMSGESVENKNEPMTLTYDDLMNVDLRLIMPADRYKYNSKYKVYEDMSEDDSFMKNLYASATKLKIVGVVCAKPGKTTRALNPGVAYTSKLIDYIIDYSKDTEIVKKQIKNSDIDIFSNKKFDDKSNNFDFQFSDLVKVDSKKLESAFNIKIDQKDLENQTKKSMEDIVNSITTDTTPAKDLFTNNLKSLADKLLSKDQINVNNINDDVVDILSSEDAQKMFDAMEKEYILPADFYEKPYQGLLTGLLQAYVIGYNTYMKAINPNYQESDNVPVVAAIKDTLISKYLERAEIQGTIEQMAALMTETKIKTDVGKKVGELTGKISSSFANAFNIDQNKIASAFTLNFSENELARVVNAMMNPTETTQKTNLIHLGYQDKDEPTYISFYFQSFEGKEHFLSFIDNYNKLVGDDKEIQYSDTTGILMSSVKTIVNAVSYVLIAFVSISLVVSSIMIGVITYISVYERTKEIGILRAIGASKGNISSIFNAETFIIGLLSGLFGIGISYTFIPIINSILRHFTGNIALKAMLYPISAVRLVILAIILTLIGGLIPAKSASKKDPVEALRTE